MKHSSLYATVAAAICMATVSTPSLAATLCVTRQTETSLTFTFADFGGLDYELFVAHGATDGGDDKYAWDSFEKVADIAPSPPPAHSGSTPALRRLTTGPSISDSRRDHS